MLRILESDQLSDYAVNLADCVIKTHDNKILLQRRPENWSSNAGGLNLFGGHIEKNETVIKGLIRELYEELGAKVPEKELIFIGAVTEDFTNYTEAVHVYFWHDKDNRITGCYEALPEVFESLDQVLEEKNIMEYAVWALKESQKEELL